MNIAIDYDNTYSADPTLWNAFIGNAFLRGHKVYCVTGRNPESNTEVLYSIGTLIGPQNCFFTSSQGKIAYMAKKGIDIHVWIDDNPDAIVRGIEIENNGVIYE